MIKMRHLLYVTCEINKFLDGFGFRNLDHGSRLVKGANAKHGDFFIDIVKVYAKIDVTVHGDIGDIVDITNLKSAQCRLRSAECRMQP